MSERRCRWCREAYGDGRPANFASDPGCAFTSDGVFRSANWNCAGLDALRQAAYDREVWSEDQNAAVLPFDGHHIVLSYYKHRGRTEGAWVCGGDAMRALTEDDVAEWVALSQGVTP